MNDYKENPAKMTMTESWLTEKDSIGDYDINGIQPIESEPRKRQSADPEV